jgi:uncharacterized protein
MLRILKLTAMIKKIIYLHGLESQQGGKKVDFLSQNSLVYAPKLDYKNPNEFQRILKEIQTFKPDLIIGSSMGGYFGFGYASLISLDKVILFNPALHSRSVTVETTEKEYLSMRGKVVLGKNDDVISPGITKSYLKQHTKLNINQIDNMGHRIPHEIFVKEVSEYL